MTELGLLPEEWGATRLGDLFKIKQGKALSPEHRRGISPRPFLRTANVFWGYLDLTNVDSMDFTDNEVSQLSLMPDDLLVCEGGDIGRTAIWRGQLEICCYQNHLHRLRTTRDDVYPLFYMYWMQAAYLLLGLYGGTGNKTTIPNLSQSRLKSFELPLPPLPEQKAIARVLSAIQKAIETQDKIIAAARELKKSLMRHLFTYGPVPVAEVENVPLKDTEIGPVPEHWEVVRLGDMASKEKYSFVDGPFGSNLKSIHYTNDGVLVIQSHYFTNGRFEIQNPTFTSNQKADELLRSNVKGGDIAIAKIGVNYGASAVVPDCIDRAVLSGNTMKLTVDNQTADKYFVSACLAFYKENGIITKSLSTKTAQPALTLSGMKALKLPRPPIYEQQEIARIISSVDNKIQSEENRKSAFQALFKTMLHQLMTGKVRVKDLEATAA